MSNHWYSVADDVDDVVERLADLETEEPTDPPEAIERGFVDSIDEYYGVLHEVALELARRRIEESRSPDADLVNAVRSLESVRETRNLLSERLRDWRQATGEPPPLLRDLEVRVESLEDFEEDTEEYIMAEVNRVAPNLASLAPPLVAARLIELAGGLEELARMPSSTVQVLGAEDALFRHLQSGTPPPKHGVIYLHPYVRDTPEEERGSAARAVAGKLAIAARIDYYSGDLRPELGRELEEKIDAIRSR